MSIRGNMWYSHYRGKGGDAISFVRRFFHMDFKEAVRFLLEQSAAPAAGPVQCERQEQKQLRLPSKDSSEEQVRRYLTGIRKVSADVAGYFIETGQVYQSRAEGVRQGQEQCNLVLVGMDRDGAPRQAHIKGMRQRAFRYDAPGSDKAYGFRHMGGSGPLYVFEAAVDLMSYVSLCSEDWRQGNYLALNGTAEAALFRTLEEYPEVRGVVLALDNDAGGIEGVMRLTGLLREKGYTDVSVQLPAWKDWNEELKARGGWMQCVHSRTRNCRCWNR
ncbi:toprim domain-containing protein [Ruthenibacterium lactatiformans]|uniref:toprim domain-containing protein n=1 Tax=Ruthenibacterium lactatiformans TaxID=1550024 RepID=UPI00399F2C93